MRWGVLEGKNVFSDPEKGKSPLPLLQRSPCAWSWLDLPSSARPGGPILHKGSPGCLPLVPPAQPRASALLTNKSPGALGASQQQALALGDAAAGSTKERGRLGGGADTPELPHARLYGAIPAPPAPRKQFSIMGRRQRWAKEVSASMCVWRRSHLRDPLTSPRAPMASALCFLLSLEHFVLGLV